MKTQNTNITGDINQVFSRSGFTLIEVMVALVVMLIGMLGVMGMQYYAVSGNAASREIRIATNLSKQLIEQTKTTPYAILTSNTDTPPVDTAISGQLQFTRRWWVVPNCVGLDLVSDDNTCNNLATSCTNGRPDTTPVPAVSAVRARTCWTDKDGVPHAVTLDTLRWDENVLP